MRKLLFLLTLLMMLCAVSQADVLGRPVQDGCVDLTGLRGMDDKLKTLISDLQASPEVTEVDLTDVYLKTANRVKLVETFPDIHFTWSVKVGSLYYSTTDTVMDLDKSYEQAKLSEIAAALRALPNIKTVKMYKYRPSLKGMEDYLINVFPEVEFEWTLDWIICYGSRVRLRTDATAFSTNKGRREPRYTADEIWARLKYFPDLLAIDLGHNNVSDLSFLANFPKLRRLIVVDSLKPVTDISVLAELKDLEYIELFMQDITDLTPLANHTELLDLNLCHNNISDLTPLYSCTKLQRLWISNNPNLTEEEIAAFKEALPNCRVESKVWGSTDAGWREHPRYFVMINSFEKMKYNPFTESQPLEE